MSSISVSVSGQRALSSTINASDRTAASMPSKPGDMINVSIGSIREARIILPAKNARIERYKGESGDIVQVLVISRDPDGNEHASTNVSLEALPAGGHPHASINVKKEPEDHKPYTGYLDGRSLDETIDLEIPPTEPDETTGSTVA